MKIFTSYFGAIKRLPRDFVPVAICGGMTFPWTGLRYPKLAPKRLFFNAWKLNHDNDFYVRHFYAEVLSELTPQQVRSELADLVGGEDKTVVLCCYETPEKFCHRHIVAQWLGDDVFEYKTTTESQHSVDKNDGISLIYERALAGTLNMTCKNPERMCVACKDRVGCAGIFAHDALLGIGGGDFLPIRKRILGY